jgi:hypothetical protein
MGKYTMITIEEITEYQTEKLFYLNAIVNELAEANRLKRLELIKIHTDHYQNVLDEA